jgi:hypothetical protein
LTRRIDATTPTTLLKERVAQLVEHLTFNQEVMGSNPIALTIEISGLGVELNIKGEQRPLPDNIQDNIREISLQSGPRLIWRAPDQGRPRDPA